MNNLGVTLSCSVISNSAYELSITSNGLDALHSATMAQSRAGLVPSPAPMPEGAGTDYGRFASPRARRAGGTPANINIIPQTVIKHLPPNWNNFS